MTNKKDLFNEVTFYPAFIKDMLSARKEIVIYCPFISKYRAEFFKKTLLKLRSRNVSVFIFTRPIEEHEGYMHEDIRLAIKIYEDLGVHVTYLEGSIHEKVAIVDWRVIWQGSLNILSQKKSKELMMRIVDEDFAAQILSTLGLNQKLIKRYELDGKLHGLRSGTGQKIKIFLLEPIIQVIKWSLSAVYQVMIILLKGFFGIFNMLDVILR